ncbi:MAG: hypothetical protein Q7S35_10450 [Candidatus Limnocylindrales bacterium]|nr:hypothetical protein [Candidatus Limnocylindrales bacterium]
MAPTPVPFVAAGWPLTDFTERDSEPIFGPDGTVYLLAGRRDAHDDYRQSLVALDTAGFMKPGWPIEEPPGSHFGSLAVGPDGSVYLGECGGPEVGCVLHRLDATGRELPGWPFELPRDFACPAGYLCGSTDFGPNGTTYFFDWREVGGLQVIAIDASGQVMSGWPVVPDAPRMWWSNPHVGSDGTLFILGVPDGSDGLGSLAALAPDGRPRSGWPVSVPSESDYLLGPQGTVVVWSWIDRDGELCSSPRRTVFTVLGHDGRALPGWPRGSTGYASSPVVDADGTVYYVSALGNVYAHDRAGEVKAGWPVAVPGASVWCGPTYPYLAPDGTIYVLSGEVAGLSPDGHPRQGWPYRPAGDLKLPCSPPAGDTDGFPSPHAPAFGPDGTIYLVVCHADPSGSWLEVVALDDQGQVKSGWPYRPPIDLTPFGVGPLTLSPDGRLFVRGGYNTDSFLLALDPDGRLSE